jgi:uncharacterized protein (TIGR03435 family)
MKMTKAMATLALMAGTAAAAGLHAQSSDTRQTFDVASIKREMAVVSGITFSARSGTLTVRNNPLTNVIGNGYGVRRYQVIGGPDWISSDRYDIQAKAAGDATREQMMVMVQSLLAERFKLQVHRETRELPIYVLTIAKGGIKARPSREGGCVQFDPRNPPRPVSGQPPTPFCGNNNITATTWNATAIDTAGMAGALVGVLGRRVVDKTGLAGRFDIHVQWTPDQAPAGVDGAAASNGDAAPPLFTVLEDQLGLKLESARGPVDVLIIDHVERPSED